MKLSEVSKEILKDTAIGAIVLAVICGLGCLVLVFHETCVPILGAIVLVVFGAALSMLIGALARDLWHTLIKKDWNTGWFI